MQHFVLEKDKVGITIGARGRTKKLLEEELGVKLSISKTGEVKIEGQPFQEYLAIKVFEAINLSFTYKDALQLKNPDFNLEVINVKDYAKSKARLKELKGRLIGREGRVKELMEELGDVQIKIKENKIGIIGKAEDVFTSREAISSLLRGAKHARIFKWLEHKGRFYKTKEKREEGEES